MLVNGFIVERVEYGNGHRSTLPLDVPGNRFEVLAGSTGAENVRPFARERSGNASVIPPPPCFRLRQRFS